MTGISLYSESESLIEHLDPLKTFFSCED